MQKRTMKSIPLPDIPVLRLIWMNVAFLLQWIILVKFSKIPIFQNTVWFLNYNKNSSERVQNRFFMPIKLNQKTDKIWILYKQA